MPAADDPSGYQHLIAGEAKRSLRWLLAFEVICITGLMLYFARWSVYRWSLLIFVQLAFALVRSQRHVRQMGYHCIADRGRSAVVETLAAFALITLFVLVQSRFHLWFAQDPFCVLRSNCRG